MAEAEQLLQERPETFRSLVVRQTYKVVCYIEDTVILHCRRMGLQAISGENEKKHPQI